MLISRTCGGLGEPITHYCGLIIRPTTFFFFFSGKNNKVYFNTINIFVKAGGGCVQAPVCEWRVEPEVWAVATYTWKISPSSLSQVLCFNEQ